MQHWHQRLYIALFAVLVFALSGCAPAVPAAQPAATSAAAEEAAAPAAADPLAELVAAAQAEGELTVITLPRDWCNYGEMMDTFTLPMSADQKSMCSLPLVETSSGLAVQSRPSYSAGAVKVYFSDLLPARVISL